jgi:hypothetical protein
MSAAVVTSPESGGAPSFGALPEQRLNKPDLSAALKDGLIPEYLVESFRLVDPSTPLAREFERECLRCCERIAGERLKALGLSPRFLLSDLPDPNAFILTEARPPIIVITRAMFQREVVLEGKAEKIIANEADLMFVIDHEINHLEASVKYPTKQNGKIEEGVGYCRPLLHLHDVGVPPELGRRFMEKLLAGPKPSMEQVWAQILSDPHPLTENTKTIMDNTLAAIRVQRGDVRAKQPVRQYEGTTLAGAIDSAPHRSYLVTQLEQRTGHGGATATEQLSCLMEVFSTMPAGYSVRVLDIAAEVRRINVSATPSRDRDEFSNVVDQFANALLSRAAKLDGRSACALYSALSRSVTETGSAPLGVLKEIARHVSSFVELGQKTNQRGELSRAAATLNSAVEKTQLLESPAGRMLARQVSFENFPIFDSDRVSRAEQLRSLAKLGVVSWQPVYVESESNVEVFRAALLLGLDSDRRFLGRFSTNGLSPECLLRMHHGEPDLSEDRDLKRLSGGPREKEGVFNANDLKLSADGKIVTLIDDRGEQARLRRSACLEQLRGVNLSLAKKALAGDEAAIMALGDKLILRRDALHYKEMMLGSPALWVKLNQGGLGNPKLALDCLLYLESKLSEDPHGVVGVIRELGIADLNPHPRLLISWMDKKGAPERTFKQEAMVVASRLLANLKDESLPLSERLRVLSHIHETRCTNDPGVSLEQLSSFSKAVLAPWRSILIERGVPAKALDSPVALRKFFDSSSEVCGTVRAALGVIAASQLTAKPSLDQTVLYFQALESDPVDRSNGHDIPMDIVRLAKSRFSAAILQKHLAALPLESAASAWKSLDSFSALVVPISDKLLRELVTRIEASRDAAEALKVSLVITAGGRIGDLDARERLYNLIPDAVHRILGADDGSPAFKTRFVELAERVADGLPVADRFTILDSLAGAVLAQKSCCDAIRTIKSRFTDSQLQFSEVLPKVLEGFLRGARSVPLGNQALLEFLLAPFSSESFEELCIKTDRNPLDYFGGDSPAETFGALSPEEIAAAYGRLLHENFWGLPLAGRASAAKELLVTANNAEDNPSIPKAVVERILASVVNSEDPGFRYTVTALTRYLEASRPYERYLALGALLTAAEPGRGERSKVRTGQALAIIASHMGPAEKKLAQSASSDPRTRADIRADLATAKYDIDPPSRPELVAWVEGRRAEIEEIYNLSKQTRPLVGAKDGARPPTTMASIGKVLGSASISVTVALEMSDGATVVLSLRRPWAQESGERGFGTFLEMLRLDAEAVGADENAATLTESGTAEILKDLADMSRERLSLETNYRIAPGQYETLDGIAGSSRVTVEGMVFESSTPRVLGAGEDLFLMELVPGDNLERLQERGDASSEFVRQAAMKTLTSELWNILQLKFDCDRHVGQIHFQPISSKLTKDFHLDAKALSERPWTDGEIDLFARILAQAVPAIIGGSSAVEAFVDAQRSCRAVGHPDRALVCEVQKALTSLGDYQQLLTAEDSQRCLLAALRTGVNAKLAARLEAHGLPINDIVVSLAASPDPELVLEPVAST